MATERPEQYPDWANTDTVSSVGSSNKVQPSQTKRNEGWAYKEFPPRNHFNWWQNIVGRFIRNHDERLDDLDERTNSIETSSAPTASTTQVGVSRLSTVSEGNAASSEAIALTPLAAAELVRKVVGDSMTFTSGSDIQTQNRTNQNGRQPVETENFIRVFPPPGYSITHLKAFLPSISRVDFQDDVQTGDILFCQWRKKSNHVVVFCQNNENNAASLVNYLAVWSKL